MVVKLGRVKAEAWIAPLGEPMPGVLVAPTRYHRDQVSSLHLDDIREAMGLEPGALRVVVKRDWDAEQARSVAA